MMSKPTGHEPPDIGIEIVDARNVLGVVVFRMTDAGVMSELKAMRISRSDTAELFDAMADQLRAQPGEAGLELAGNGGEL